MLDLMNHLKLLICAIPVVAILIEPGRVDFRSAPSHRPKQRMLVKRRSLSFDRIDELFDKVISFSIFGTVDPGRVVLALHRFRD